MRVVLISVISALLLFGMFDYYNTSNALKASREAVVKLEAVAQVREELEVERFEWREEFNALKKDVQVRLQPHKQELRSIANERLNEGSGSDMLSPDVVRLLKDYSAKRVE